jgi:hypothetical protein
MTTALGLFTDEHFDRPFWGLLGPDMLHSERRTRTLGLGAAVRSFNDLAVPGLGGVWFGKQLLLATLGVAVAARLRADGHRIRNIETANAIEALACWLALSQNQWKRDARLRGARKLLGKEDLSFSAVRKPTFYVTQPMRMTTVQPLWALGLVDSDAERFNSFDCSDDGRQFIETSCRSYYPSKRTVLDHLVGWSRGQHNSVKSSPPLQKALSPLEPLRPESRDFLRDMLVRGKDAVALRRRNAVKWVEQLRMAKNQTVEWGDKPRIVEADHWHDLHVGALFFQVRDAAISVLDYLEEQLGGRRTTFAGLTIPFSSISTYSSFCASKPKVSDLFSRILFTTIGAFDAGILRDLAGKSPLPLLGSVPPPVCSNASISARTGLSQKSPRGNHSDERGV